MTTPAQDIVVLSHLRWGFVFQRPNHLLVRAARSRRVHFVEEPIYGDGEARLELASPANGLSVLTPHLPHGADGERDTKELLRAYFTKHALTRPILWFYTPMMLPLVDGIEPSLVIYDCMDELSAFKNAPQALRTREMELFSRADLVFTGGQSLYEAKKAHHPSVHAFPSSVDAPHFAKAKEGLEDPADQRDIAHPRVGFFGVIDERMDLELIEKLAKARPNISFVMLGPVVKIDPASLPQAPNLHWLGQKTYAELPSYLAGWDAAFMPFALNESTRFISPTKTLEYLAAGKPVVSTAIKDVVSPYGERDIVRIAGIEGFPAAVDGALAKSAAEDERRARGDRVVSATSWDATWSAMEQLIDRKLETPRAAVA